MIPIYRLGRHYSSLEDFNRHKQVRVRMFSIYRSNVGHTSSRPGVFNLPQLDTQVRVRVFSIYWSSVLKKASGWFQFTAALSPRESVQVISIYRSMEKRPDDFNLPLLWVLEKASTWFQFTARWKSVRMISIYLSSRILKKASRWFQFTSSQVLKKRPYNFNLPVLWILESVQVISIYRLSVLNGSGKLKSFCRGKLKSSGRE